jgi:hypothetical protein
MVRLAIPRILAGVLAAVASGVRADAYDDGDKVGTPRPHAVFVATTVSDIHNGLWTDEISGDETPRSCKTFVLRRSDVREYFQQARRASRAEYLHDLDMSRCHAKGRVRFASGEQGDWAIDRERRGRLTLSDGRSYYFFCEACKAKAFPAP